MPSPVTFCLRCKSLLLLLHSVRFSSVQFSSSKSVGIIAAAAAAAAQPTIFAGREPAELANELSAQCCSDSLALEFKETGERGEGNNSCELGKAA